jgi:putative ABC transport system permease protein
MFLGFNEIKYEKSKFVLIVVVIALISYLTYFLTGLAYGLATSYTQGIDKCSPSGIILSKDSNNNISRSLLLDNDYNNVKVSNKTDKAPLGVSASTVNLNKKIDVALFGIEQQSFLMPNITEGNNIEKSNDVIASDSLKYYGLKLNDSIQLGNSYGKYKVVGFSDHATFQTAPIIYLQMKEWRTSAADILGMNSMKNDSTINAIVTRGKITSYSSDRMSYQTIQSYYFTLPGYQAQVLTFSIMIGFLIFIASFVLAIFIYILTIQKKSLFGVLKAEGVSNNYISRSVRSQIILLVVVGSAIGLFLTFFTSVFLSGKIPFLVQPIFFIGITVLFLACSLIGGIASVFVVTKIDPVRAIS